MCDESKLRLRRHSEQIKFEECYAEIGILCPKYKSTMMKLRRSVLLLTFGARDASVKNLA